MPKFSDIEKEIIRNKLHIEGEKLFTAHGIKKVTVDDLVKATGIAKGSFYVFFESKEHLYMDILGRLQGQIWDETDAFLKANANKKPRELTRATILWAIKQMQKYSLIVNTDNETVEYLYRKLPREIIDVHTRDDMHALISLQKYGVSFSCNVEIAVKALQLTAVAIINMLDGNDPDFDAIANILITGLVNEIVSE